MRKILTVLAAGVSLLAADLVWAHAAAAQVPVQPTTQGEAIVGFHRGFLPNLGVDQLLGNVLPITRVSTKGSFVTVRVPDIAIVKQVIAALPGVAYVEDNAAMHALVTPNDPRYGSQYGPTMMGAPAAWGSTAGYGSANVKVAVIDSGILRTHQDFAAGRVLQGRDYVSNDNEPNDTCGHGTHVAGTVGATTNNGLGVAGMSQATIIPLKALAKSTSIFSSGCSGSTAGIAQAIIDAADQGARVISMSIGGGSSSAMLNAVNYAHNKGVILVAAAGNDGGANSVDYPGAYPNVIAVGALDSNKARASYSDGGSQLDIMGPGSGVISTYTGNGTTYSSLSGTSMATPHVSGAIALALSCAPAATAAQVTSALYSTADDLGAAGYDTAYGNGLARVDKLVNALCPSGPPPPNQSPVASFTTTQSGSLGVAVNGAGSTDPDSDPLTYAWNFGDGSTGTGATTTHTYAAGGTYTIGLTVSDGRGG
ncbi:MAG: S8 family serine peptidase, partial [Acidimicrobiales bacterium]|nr:S8 family serine peptidase [Acidimicrobiales bacterium]